MKSVFDHLLTEETKKFLEKNQNIIRSLKKKHVKTITSQLNLIDKYEFLLDSKRLVNSGDILFRPLENFRAGKHLEMYHYGIVFGLGKKSEKYVLDICSGTDVSIKTLEKFVTPYSLSEVRIKRKPKDVELSDIIRRADSLIFESYSVENLNCEQFANYCVFNKAESIGLQNAAKVAASVVDLITVWTDHKLAFTPKSKQTKSIGKFNEQLKAVSKDIKKLK